MKVSSLHLAGHHKDGDQRITKDFQAFEEEGFQRTEQDHRLRKDETPLSSLNRDFTDMKMQNNKTKLLNYFRHRRVTFVQQEVKIESCFGGEDS